MFAIREEVSTHSRPKAAGYAGEDLPETEKLQHTAARRRLERLSNARYQISRFNTQPPEGGWPKNQPHSASRDCFNTQPPEGGWPVFVICHISSKKFQHTAARRRLALMDFASGNDISVSTHSRPKAAGILSVRLTRRKKFQHTAARRRLGKFWRSKHTAVWFQHTAARRRLGLSQKPCSIRFRSPDFAKLPRKARTRV